MSLDTDTEVEPIGTALGTIVGEPLKKGNPDRVAYYTQTLAEDLENLSPEELVEKWGHKLAALETERYEDSATGLKVKEAGIKLLQREIDIARESGGNVSVVMLDLDRFKKVNDTQGHAAGDRAILLLSNYLATKTSRETIACRYGGDEFFLIMPKSPPDAAIGLSQRVIDEIEEIMREQGFDVTASAGISYLRDDTTDAKEMMREADMALLEAKEKGKNRFEVYLPKELK